MTSYGAERAKIDQGVEMAKRAVKARSKERIPDDLDHVGKRTIVGIRGATQRGTATRARILRTAIALLGARGSAATNTQLVSDMSGVARGSILHQFPTRLDLMAGVFEYGTQEMLGHLRKQIARYPAPRDRLGALFNILWEVSNSEAGLAVSEIQDAAHWDEDLGRIINPLTSTFLPRIFSELAEVASQAGISKPEALMPSLALMLAAMRGIVIGSRFKGTEELYSSALEQQQAFWGLVIQKYYNDSKI